MTQAMLVGADQLGNIPHILADFGIRVANHVSGRNSAHQRLVGGLPSGTQLLILFTDFLGHNVMKSFRDAAKRANVKVVCCRRSVCAVKQSLELGGFRCSDGSCASPDAATTEKVIRFKKKLTA